MALTRDQKSAQLTELKEKMKNAKSVIFIHYIGLTVAQISALRAKLRGADAEMKVCKKTLLQLASKETLNLDIDDKSILGPVACVFNNADPTGGASVTFKFAKDNDKVKLIGGIFEGKILTAAEANSLAQLPSRETLLAMFMMMCNAPLGAFARGSNAPLTGFARALSELAKKGGASPAPVAPSPSAPAPAAEAAAPAPASEPAAPTA